MSLEKKLSFVTWMPIDVLLVEESSTIVQKPIVPFNAVFLHQQQKENFIVKRN